MRPGRSRPRSCPALEGRVHRPSDPPLPRRRANHADGLPSLAGVAVRARPVVGVPGSVEKPQRGTHQRPRTEAPAQSRKALTRPPPVGTMGGSTVDARPTRAGCSFARSPLLTTRAERGESCAQPPLANRDCGRRGGMPLPPITTRGCEDVREPFHRGFRGTGSVAWIGRFAGLATPSRRGQCMEGAPLSACTMADGYPGSGSQCRQG
jgi:hypothetical protein